MSEQELAALNGAADEAAVSAEAEASEATENTAGQDEGQPAPEETPEEKTKSQIRRERREAAERREKEEAAATARKLAETEARLQAIRAAAASVAEPKATDFQDPQDFAAAKFAFAQMQMAARMRENEVSGDIAAIQQGEKIAQQMRLQDRQREFHDGLSDARAAYPDFDEAFKIAVSPQVVSQPLSEMILESERPHDLAYHLGKNPQLARQLSSMTPVQAAREIGRLEAAIAASKTPTPTKAPDPIRPVRGNASVSVNPEKMSASEYRAWREAGGKL